MLRRFSGGSSGKQCLKTRLALAFRAKITQMEEVVSRPDGDFWAYKEIKRANRTSHRYNRLPLLPSDPGGVQQELVVPACRGAKVEDYLRFEILDLRILKQPW
jgi:hypothetical protein